MILIDPHILVYAAGVTHPHNVPSARLLDGVARDELKATINAQTMQELLHRYRAIKRWKDGRQLSHLARLLAGRAR